MVNKTPGPVRPAGRRRLVFGPGLIIALALSLYIAHQQGLFRKSGPPSVERVTTSAPKQPPAADIDFLLERADELRLTEEQVGQLRDLREEWKNNTATQRAALAREQKELNKFMEGAAKTDRRTPLSEIQRRSAAFSELSRQLATARRAYWQHALLVLDPDQRKAAQKALREHLELPPESPPQKSLPGQSA